MRFSILLTQAIWCVLDRVDDDVRLPIFTTLLFISKSKQSNLIDIIYIIIICDSNFVVLASRETCLCSLHRKRWTVARDLNRHTHASSDRAIKYSAVRLKEARNRRLLKLVLVVLAAPTTPPNWPHSIVHDDEASLLRVAVLVNHTISFCLAHCRLRMDVVRWDNEVYNL